MTPDLQPVYTRSDPRGRFPYRHGTNDLERNRLAVFWRPLIDLTDSELAPLRLRMIRPVASWLMDPDGERRSWFSMIGVPGLRHQVVRHAGLPNFDCRDPTGLSPDRRTPQWQAMVDLIDRFYEIGDARRALVVFHLAQLSYCQFAIDLAGPVELDGDPIRDHYAYEVARIHARTPGHARYALSAFDELARSSTDRRLALAACFQGIGHTLRAGSDAGMAQDFERRGAEIIEAGGVGRDWHSLLVVSRFERAVAVLRVAEGRLTDARKELRTALDLHEQIADGAGDEVDEMVVRENRLYLLELEIQIALRERRADLRALCEALVRLDPYCVEARLRAGDGFTAVGDYAEAARWYSLAGELGTGAGALAWFKAGQCYDLIGDRGSAANAMGRCLELDETAVEPRTYLESAVSR